MSPSPKRCAVYTRKSTEAGLEQDFNSLDAQREACLAYIKSQKHEGWTALSNQYDDGGFSGGSMERPGLKKLLEDVENGRVDTIVVYKVDRLTRSLTDFAKIIELLDSHGASFVSVTQQFNTTSSMGRLTLNVLLSFAQFEREVTSERIRDKIAASKAKGIWMGGVPPLGYDLEDRQLIVNPTEAETVRKIFSAYLEVGTVKALKTYVDEQACRTKTWTSGSGRCVPGSAFTRGRLHHLLKNPIYIGRIVHKDKLYEGLHEAIVPMELWTLVQKRLKEQWGERKTVKNQKSPCWLVGKLHHSDGRTFRSTQTTKGGRRYYYYATGDTDDATSSWSLPAKDIEGIVVSGITEALSDPHRLIAILAGAQTDASTLKQIQIAASKFAVRQDAAPGQEAFFQPLIDQIMVDQHRIEISFNERALRGALSLPPLLSSTNEPRKTHAVKITIPVQLKRRGVETRLVLHAEKPKPQNYNEKLARLVAKAHVWFEQIKSGERKSVEEIAAAEKLDGGDVSRALPLAFLAPSIVENILHGRQSMGMTTESLRRDNCLPYDWKTQSLRLE